MIADPPDAGRVSAIGLANVADADLAAVAAALDRGELRAPFSATALQSRGFGHLAEAFAGYLQLDVAGLRAVLDAVLAERRHRAAPKLTLVWTGEDPGISHTRYTRIVLPELFARARKHVLIAGYSFDSGEVLEALHHAMRDNGVSCTLFVDVDQLVARLKSAARAQQADWSLVSAPLRATQSPSARGRAAIALFFRFLWPFADHRPVVYFDPRTAVQGNLVSLHAKCVVVDHELTLITSANFTERGQERNFEAGVAIEDRAFAASLERQWTNLIDAGVLERA